MNAPLLLSTAMAGWFVFGNKTPTLEPLAVGAPVPDLVALDQDGQTIHLRAEAATGWTLVYFYPKADTPGCTAQACSLRDGYAALTDKGIRVFGVSTDTVASQKAFHEKYHLPFRLLADPDKKIIAAFGVSTLPLVGWSNRQAYLFRDGKLHWRDLHASTKKQADDILAVVANPR